MNNDGRRHLDPTHTTRYVHIPHLREKLEWLYGYHPLIKSQERLADELEVSPATLSTWHSRPVATKCRYGWRSWTTGSYA